MMMKLLRWLLGGLVCLVIVFACGEWIVRNYFPQEHLPPDFFVPDPVLGYRVAPNYHGIHPTRIGPIPLDINSLSMRDHEYGPRSAGTPRLYFLGDSFIFGNRVPLEQTVTKVLERRLRAETRRPIEVVNAGMPGYSTYQELTYLEQTIDKLEPDIVLLGMCVGNDLWDNLMYSKRNATSSAEGGAGAWRGGAGGLRARTTLLLKRSDFYLLIRRAFNDTVRDKDAEEPRGKVDAAEVESTLSMTADIVAKMAAVARERKIPFAVLLIAVPDGVVPLSEQADLNSRFTALLEKSEISVFDLSPAFAAHAKENLYYTLHWTPRGHEIVADAVAEFLRSQNWLSSDKAPAEAP